MLALKIAKLRVCQCSLMPTGSQQDSIGAARPTAAVQPAPVEVRANGGSAHATSSVPRKETASVQVILDIEALHPIKGCST